MITRNKLISQASYYLKLVKQWRNIDYTNSDFIQNALKYAHMAEAIIECLEENDCGSIGGFDNGHHGSNSLEERLKWLREKKEK